MSLTVILVWHILWGMFTTNPIDMDVDSRNAEEEANDDLMAMRSKSNDSKYLKYRQKHSVSFELIV